MSDQDGDPRVGVDLDPASMSREELRVAAGQLSWFHAIDFGDFQSRGRFPPGEPQNVTLFDAFDLMRHIDLSGSTCLDIGTFDGLVAFGMKLKGASRVIATDSSSRDTFQLARQLLDLDIDYVPDAQIKDLRHTLPDTRFDLVVCNGVLYHMLNPLSAFFTARRLLKRDGLLMIETYISRSGCSEPALVLNSEARRVVPEPHTYLLPNAAAVRGMLKLACFDVLATRSLVRPDRFTALGRAVEPDRVRDRSDLLIEIHKKDFSDWEFRIADLNLSSEPSSGIRFAGPEGDRRIDPRSFEPDFAPHPLRLSNPVGRSQWAYLHGNLPSSFRERGIWKLAARLRRGMARVLGE